MAKKWEPACVEFIPKTNGNREAEDAEQIRVYFRPFGVGENIDYLEAYSKLGAKAAAAAEHYQKAAAKKKPTDELKAKIQAVDRAVFDHAFGRVEKVTRGAAVCDCMADYRDTVYPDREMTMEIANHITLSGTVREEERPT